MRRRTAFTLVELLVVAAVFAMLFALALSGGRPSMSGRIRQAAQSIASTLLATQSSALGNPLGAAVIFEPAVAGSAVVTTCFDAEMRPFITGQCSVGMPPTNLAATSAAVTITPDNAETADLADGYKVQFFERSPAQPPSVWFAYASGTASLRTASSQTSTNTIWPRPVGVGPFDVRVARYPAKAATRYDLPRNVAIDLRYSGIGDDPATTWGGLANKGAIAVSFDSVGGVDALMQQVLGPASSRTVQPTRPASPVYLLVGLKADVEADKSLSMDSSLWVVIQPQSGRITVSANVGQAARTAVALRAARAKARASVAIGK